MLPLYDYKAFDFPKIGLFQITTNVYGPNGWETKIESIKIIGETDLHYISELLKTEGGEWIEDLNIKYCYILPLGPHKSRLVEWTETQLELFR